ncbi:MAG: superoxide dismutase [Cytophagaceae bacterium]|nr:superoxide dismutase [Cytophagaceae bacterium]|tara:strand:- start:1326 stop:1919 length:594 start_codon:yes stop_codon:yes gene_type:complete
MKKFTLLFVLCAMVSMTACKETKKTDEEDPMAEGTDMEDDTAMDEPMAKELTINLEPKSDSGATGTVTFTEEDGKVKMTAVLEGLSEGTHAIHIHETADCSSPDGKSAGGHWNPTHEKHGKWGDPEGYHKGDIGNFEADASGNGTITMTTDEWCIGCDDATKNIVGKGIIVHQGTDDFVSQPSGDAGARVMCGGIIE